MHEETQKKSVFIQRLKQLGFIGFLFFFIKGLLWLIVPVLAGWYFW